MRARIAAVCVALMPGVCGAGTVYVYNNNDSGDGSLRQAITVSNAAGGSNTILWASAGGESIFPASDLSSINGGTTLDVSASTSPVSIAGDYAVPLGGAVTFRNDTLTSTFTVSAVISGAGSLTKTGSGVLALSNSNTYSGGTSVNGGVLLIGADSALGASSGGLAFGGGTLRVSADMSSARNVVLNSGGGAFDTDSYTLGLSGIISGSGALGKEGSGVLVLGGANTYSGGTVISSGTIQLGADNALGTGDIAVSGDGTLDLAGYTQNAAALSGGGTVKMKLQPGVANLNISGNAALGGVLSVNFSPQLILQGQTFTPITAGSVSGTFSSIASPAAVSFVPVYDAVSVMLTADMVPFANTAATASQRASAGVLEGFRASPSGDMATVISNLYTLSAAQLQSALEQTSPSPLLSLRALEAAGSDVQSSVLRRRALHLAGADDLGRAAYPGAKKGAAQSRLGFFVSPAGVKSETRNSQDAAGYSLYDGGLLAGADYRFGERAAAGVLAGYLAGSADFAYPNSGSVSARSARYGAYAVAAGERARMALYAGRANDSFSVKRDLAFGEIYRQAQSDPRGSETNLYAMASCDFRHLGHGTFSPSAELNYDDMRVDPFTETGADSLNLSADGQHAVSLRSILWLRYSDRREMGAYALASHLGAGWRHQFRQQSALTARLAAGGDAMSVSASSGRDGLRAEGGVSAGWGARTAFSLDYNGDFSSDATEHIVNAGLHFAF
ncbi:MAG: autotransporter domain-containing protein [Elusimicrobiales bacterium]